MKMSSENLNFTLRYRRDIMYINLVCKLQKGCVDNGVVITINNINV